MCMCEIYHKKMSENCPIKKNEIVINDDRNGIKMK